MITKTFKKEVLKGQLDLPWNSDIIQEDEIIDTSRWSVHHSLVFEFEGKFWHTHYSVGATESQDESPWEYDDDVDCTQVEQKEVVVKKWVNVDE